MLKRTIHAAICALYRFALRFVQVIVFLLTGLLLLSGLLFTCFSTDMETQLVLFKWDNPLLTVPGSLLLTAALCGIALPFWRGAVRKKCPTGALSSLSLLRFLVLGWCVLAGIVLILFSKSVPAGDGYSVYAIAESLAAGDTSVIHPTDSYLSYYPQQIGLAAFWEMLIRIWNLIPVSLPAYHFIKLVYLGLGCVIILFQEKTVRLLWADERAECLYLVLAGANLPLLMYTSFVYGEIPSFAAISVGFYLLLRLIRREKHDTCVANHPARAGFVSENFSADTEATFANPSVSSAGSTASSPATAGSVSEVSFTDTAATFGNPSASSAGSAACSLQQPIPFQRLPFTDTGATFGNPSASSAGSAAFSLATADSVSEAYSTNTATAFGSPSAASAGSAASSPATADSAKFEKTLGTFRSRTFPLALGSLFFLTLSVLLRKNSLIFIIAALIVTVLHGLWKRRPYLLLWSVLCAGCALAVLPCVERYYEVRSGSSISSGVPAMTYFAMGMQESSRADGWYNGYNFDTYRDSGMDAGQASAVSWEFIRERAAYFRENPGYAARFYLHKYLSQWADGSYACRQATLATFGGRTAFFTALYEGTAGRILITYCNLYQNILYGGAFIFCLITLLRKRAVSSSDRPAGISESFPTAFRDSQTGISRDSISNDDLKTNFGIVCPPLPVLLGLISVLGGFLFHMIWEANARYIFLYGLALLPYTAKGLSMFADFLHKHLRQPHGRC